MPGVHTLVAGPGDAYAPSGSTALEQGPAGQGVSPAGGLDLPGPDGQPPSSNAASSRQGKQAGKAAKPGRNKPCPCGSGKKQKACCGVAVAAAERRRRALEAAGDGTAVEAPVAQVATLCI